VALVELLVVPLCFLYNCYGAFVYYISGLSLNAHNLLQAAIHHISTVHDFDNGNVNLTKCISCFRLNLELKPCFGLHRYLLPLNQTLLVLISCEVCEIL